MEEEGLLLRIGTFFIVVAGGFITLFVVSDVAETAYFDFFFIGVLLGGLGIYIRRKVPTPESSGRFSTWKKWRSGRLKDEMVSKREAQKAERAKKAEERRAASAAKRKERRDKLSGSLRSFGKRNKNEEE